MTGSNYRIQGATGDWEVVIGLEVHAQIVSNTKLASDASRQGGRDTTLSGYVIQGAAGPRLGSGDGPR